MVLTAGLRTIEFRQSGMFYLRDSVLPDVHGACGDVNSWRAVRFYLIFLSLFFLSSFLFEVVEYVT